MNFATYEYIKRIDASYFVDDGGRIPLDILKAGNTIRFKIYLTDRRTEKTSFVFVDNYDTYNSFLKQVDPDPESLRLLLKFYYEIRDKGKIGVPIKIN